jgi:alpha-beta hydrolase superfamily lysophospholipase
LRKGLDGGGSTLRLGTALNCVLSLEVVREKVIPGFNIPFCIIHGTEDYAVPIEGSKFLMNQSSTPDVEKELNCIEGAYHDLMGDPLAEESLTHWMKFIDKRIQNYQY